jgi:hypothetical protein
VSALKPARLVAVAAACNAQTRIIEAVEGLTAYAAADLDAALKELALAQGQIEQARLAVRRAIVERDGELSYVGGTRALGDLKPGDDKGAQVAMAAQHHAHADAQGAA